MITTNIVKWGLSTLILATEFNIIGESFITYETTIGFAYPCVSLQFRMLIRRDDGMVDMSDLKSDGQ